MHLNARYEQLMAVLSSAAFESYNSHSRIHPLRTLTTPLRHVFIKRDDELAFSISGSKMRKYLSLIPHLKKEGIEEVILIGGAYSNNVLGLAQLLRENGIVPRPFLRRAAQDKLVGNLLFLKMVVDDKTICWIDRDHWQDVEKIALERAQKSVKKTLVVSEGAFMEESLPGALTLSADIIANETEKVLLFDHIFVEAGTGMQAIALILGLNWLEHPAKIHVVLLADEEALFLEKLEILRCHFNAFIGSESTYPKNFTLHQPTVAPSFGAVNRSVLEEVIRFSRGEGLFLDPIYTAKLILTGKNIISTQNLEGHILFIHSGGAFSLAGFQDKLARLLSELSLDIQCS